MKKPLISLVDEGAQNQVHSARFSILLLATFILAFTLLAGFPTISQGQPIGQEEAAIVLANTIAPANPSDHYLAQRQKKEAYLRLWMQFELLRPRLRPSNKPVPGSAMNRSPNLDTQSATEFIIF
jgi:hypothetical protein